MAHPRFARWIQDPRFAGLFPRNLLHKQHAPVEHPPHDPTLQNVHMFARKEFVLSERPAAASLVITADDYYHLYVNGRFVGQGPAPSYPFAQNVNTWDIADRLAVGRNVIAVHVYYQGLRNRVWCSGDYRQGMFAELTATLPGGQCLIVASDETWRIRISPAYRAAGLVGYETQFAEDIDGRQLDHGWREVGFDDAWWSRPAVRDLDELEYIFVEQVIPPLFVCAMTPVAVQRLAGGGYLLDFGREITGRIAMRVTGPAGHRLEVRCGEQLTPEGRVRYEMRCNCRYQDFYTLAGLPRETVEFFDYKAFRYAEVLNPSGPLTGADVWAIVRHYPFDAQAVSLRCSNPVLEEVWTLCVGGVRGCSQETLVDCPSREKGQYVNDAAVSAHSHMLVTGDGRLTRKVLEDAALSARVCPGLFAVAPGHVMQEIAEASLLWPVLLWEYCQHTGDLAFVQEMLPTLDGLLRYFQRHENAGGLLADVCEKWNLVDWPANCRDGYDFDLDPATGGRGCQAVLNAHYYRCLQSARWLQQAAGRPTTVTAERLAEFRNTFVRTFRHARSGLFVDAVGSNHTSLHANAMALCAGLVPVDAHAAVIALLRNKGMACGVWFAYFLLRGLLEAGQTELAFYLMTREDERSWTNMLREGATACMEAWGAEQKWNTSFCHAWASGPIPLLVEHFLGLGHAEPGWAAVRLQPQVPRMLSSIRLQLPVPQGRLIASYSRADRVEMYSLHVPPGTRVIGPHETNRTWKVTSADPVRGAYMFERRLA